MIHASHANLKNDPDEGNALPNEARILDTDYLATSDGRIISTKYGKRREMRLLPHLYTGYLQVRLTHGGKQKTYTVHRLIWQAFYGEITDEALGVSHLDGDKQNNSIINLKLEGKSPRTIRTNSRIDRGVIINK